MNKILVSLVALIMLSGLLFAEDELMEGLDLDLLMPQTTVHSDVYFGIYAEDLDFPKAQELGYDYLYGILITQVVPGSPAAEIGMEANDIIMEVDGRQVTDKAVFDEIRAELQPGQMVKILLWHQGVTWDLDMEMQARDSDSGSKTIEIRKELAKQEKGLSTGFGGGSWIPYWFMLDGTDDVNELIAGLGFDAEAISDQGLFLNGGAGKMTVGKGLFIGGLGASYEYKEDRPGAMKDIRYNATYGGVTLDQRFAISRNFISSVGVMVGGGSHEATYSQTDSSFTWPHIFNNDTISARINRSYIVAQPRLELMYKLLGWLAIRAEVGYVYGFSTYKGWYVTDENNNKYKVSGSPDTKFQGLAFSIGPWFGF